MAESPAPLRIAKVDLVEGSLKTHRALAGNYSGTYPVMVWFSRPTDAFERMAIQEEINGLEFSDDDPMCALKYDTTLDAIATELDVIHASIDSAVANARTDREDATREDDRLIALRDALNGKLRELSQSS